MRKCKECGKEFWEYDEYDDTCDDCAFNRNETDLQICYTCGEWFLSKGMTVTCPDCQDKETKQKELDKLKNEGETQ